MSPISLVTVFCALTVVKLSHSESGFDGLPADELSLMNDRLLKFNAITAQLAWKNAVEPSSDIHEKRLKLAEVYAEWRNSWCQKGFQLGLHGSRQYYLLCRGPKYEPEQARELTEVLHQLGRVHQTNVCKNGTCYSRGADLERIMTTSRDPEVLLWAWIEWRNGVGERTREQYTKLVKILNSAARNNGYNDIGECWREELEADDLENMVDEIYAEVKSLYAVLHAVVRYKLNHFYGSDLASLNEAIPAHLLGNMWGQNWGSLIDIIVDVPKEQNVTESFRRKNYTVTDLVKRAEDYYTSLGFRPMTDKFWKNSKFVNDGKNGTECHGTAANMFRPNDYRMLLCAKVTAEDFHVIHHEMGHIQYYMQYRNQLPVFQEGTNSAFQEAIGSAVFYGAMTPNHLQRLGLIPEGNKASGIDMRLLLQRALSKLPEIPFAIALEKWRWGVFRGDITPERYNEAWWLLREKYQGLKPPVSRSEEFFDPAAVFHIVNNIPYIRYFLSGILEMQVFESLCKGTIQGYENMSKTLPISLHKCDIYGSKDGADKLREMMSLGKRIHWSDALRMITGESTFSTRPLLSYYRPLHKWLIKQIKKYKIPVGW